MRADQKVLNELLQPSGSFGNFGTKIRVAYMFGLFNAELYKDLNTLAKIRNEFAHNIKMKRLEEPPVSDWIRSLNIYATLLEVRDRPASHPDEQFAKALKFVLKNQLSTMRDSFRECVRLIIHQLNQLEKTVLELRKSQTGSSS
jgi:DNA-binding MltR family transcriptional regulator